MGIQNYLIEGISCTGKTSVCRGLEARGYHALNGDNVLAYCGDPATGEPLSAGGHDTHIWDVAKVEHLVEDQGQQASFSVAAVETSISLSTCSTRFLCSKLISKRSIIA